MNGTDMTRIVGGIISRGPGLSFTEATAVTPEGRISPEDLGIWSDDHVAGLKELATFAHSQNQKLGIQLAHAGRKASTIAPWLPWQYVKEDAGGWPGEVVAPSAIAHEGPFVRPKELSRERIHEIVQAYSDAARRSVEAGFDVIEVQAGHGFLLHEFLSPVSNLRTDEYGGSFENRSRLVLEVIDAIRAVMPSEMPLFVRYAPQSTYFSASG